MTAKKILFVLSSASQTLTGKQTGWYLPEAAHPYYVLSPHYDIDFAAPKGPNPPVDEGSVKTFTDEDSVKFLSDPTVQTKLANALTLQEVKVNEYDAIFYVGGYAPVIDLAQDPINHKLASDFYIAGKIVSAVCHGPAALVGATDAQGVSIIAGKKVTGFSNQEEEIAKGIEEGPFLIEDKLKQLGGIYEKTPEPFGAYVVVSGQLITGQNPASSKLIGEAIQKALST